MEDLNIYLAKDYKPTTSDINQYLQNGCTINGRGDTSKAGRTPVLSILSNKNISTEKN